MIGSITFHSNPYLVIMPISFISASILCELCCQMCRFYCPLRKLNCLLLLDGTDVHIWQMYTSGSTFIKKIKSFFCHYIGISR